MMEINLFTTLPDITCLLIFCFSLNSNLPISKFILALGLFLRKVLVYDLETKSSLKEVSEKIV